jgi:hypothetical protein
MNKIYIRSIIITVAIALVVVLLVLLKSRSPFGKNNSSFASEPKEEITRIEFSEGDRKLTLEKRKDNWYINGKIEARKNGIMFIIRALKEIKIKSPVSFELFETEITEKGIVPVKVKVFENRKMLKSFLVYKTESNPFGNIMKIKDQSKPFIVYIPGYEGNIGSGFSVNELFWQPYNVFNLLPSEIASVDFENLSDTSSSFSIVNNKHHYTISSGNRELSGWDSTLVTRYISYFTWIPFESWAFEMGEEERKMIVARQPHYRISVKTVGGINKVLTLWERWIGENNSKTKDSDRLYGKLQNNEELIVLRYFDIDPLLKKKTYFFQ